MRAAATPCAPSRSPGRRLVRSSRPHTPGPDLHSRAAHLAAQSRASCAPWSARSRSSQPPALFSPTSTPLAPTSALLPSSQLHPRRTPGTRRAASPSPTAVQHLPSCARARCTSCRLRCSSSLTEEPPSCVPGSTPLVPLSTGFLLFSCATPTSHGELALLSSARLASRGASTRGQQTSVEAASRAPLASPGAAACQRGGAATLRARRATARSAPASEPPSPRVSARLRFA
jgi:hypothetical protein